MPREIDVFIEGVLKAARGQKEQEFSELLLKSGISLHALNGEGLNAAMCLAQSEEDGDISHCYWLLQHGARVSDFAVGAVLGNKNDSARQFIMMMVKKEYVVNFNRLAGAAARIGNGRRMREFIELNKKNETVPDYADIALQAAMGGYGELVDELIELDKSKNGSEPDYDRLAMYAAWGDQAQLVVKYSDLYKAQGNVPSYQHIAAKAIRGGHEGLANVQFELCKQNNIKPNFMTVATSAYMVGDKVLGEKFTKLGIEQQDTNNPDYVARMTAFSGFQHITDRIVQEQLRSTGVIPNYGALAALAAQGGHLQLVILYITRASEINVRLDFQYVANCAAQGGFEDIVNYIIEMEIALSFRELAGAAFWGGHEDLGKKYISKIEALGGELPNYEHLINQTVQTHRIPLTIKLFCLAEQQLLARPQDAPPLDYYSILNMTADRGYQNFVKAIVKHMLEKGEIGSYRDLTALAANKNYPILVEMLLGIMQKENNQQDYEFIAGGAVSGGNWQLADRVVAVAAQNNIRVNYNSLAADAAHAGYEALAHYYSSLMQSQGIVVDVAFIAAAAKRGGYVQYSQALLENALKSELSKVAKGVRMPLPEKPSKTFLTLRSMASKPVVVAPAVSQTTQAKAKKTH